jgi:acyl dehydratase
MAHEAWDHGVTRAIEDVRVGDEIAALERVVTREDVKAYADASGDQNPLHQDDDVANAAGFSSVIAHGMFTMSLLATCIVEWAGDASALAKMRVQFRAPVFPGETIVACGKVTAVRPDRRTATLDVWVTVERQDKTEYPIRRGVAEVRLA